MKTILATPENLNELRSIISTARPRSAWAKGVHAYALDLIDEIEDISLWHSENGESIPALTEDLALNGARDWFRYGCGGCGAALIWCDDIAERLCNPTELAIYRKRGGDVMEWQGRALYQAWRVIVVACSNL